MLTAPDKSEKFFAPPEALQKRLDRLEDPGGAPLIVYKENKKLNNLKKGLSVEDQNIVDRLDKLKRERRAAQNIPSDSEISSRLQKLKGEAASASASHQQHPAGSGTSFYQPPDSRKPQEQSRDLLTAMRSEIEIDSKVVSPEIEIARRLALLRDQDPDAVVERKPALPDPAQFLSSSNAVDSEENLDSINTMMAALGRQEEQAADKSVKQLQQDKQISEQINKILAERDAGRKKKNIQDINQADESSSSSDEEEVDEITKKLLEEAELEQRLGMAPSVPKDGESVENEEHPEELPWCVICNEDAKLRCGGCDDDLYCASCYKEFHLDEDPSQHVAAPYKQK